MQFEVKMAQDGELCRVARKHDGVQVTGSVPAHAAHMFVDLLNKADVELDAWIPYPPAAIVWIDPDAFRSACDAYHKVSGRLHEVIKKLAPNPTPRPA